MQLDAKMRQTGIVCFHAFPTLHPENAETPKTETKLRQPAKGMRC
jgi:hypothetical protein